MSGGDYLLRDDCYTMKIKSSPDADKLKIIKDVLRKSKSFPDGVSYINVWLKIKKIGSKVDVELAGDIE